MARDTERTRRLLLDAATAEFSARGLAGARVDRIAAAAGVNKERIYQYFGSKDELFGAVLASQLTETMEAVPFEGHGVEAVTDYARRVFDYQSQHPQLARLTFWEGLERREPAAEPFRAERSASKVDRLREALPRLDRRQARELLLTIVTLCIGFQALPNVDRLYLGSASAGPRRAAQRRAAVVSAIEGTVKGMLPASSSTR